MRKIMTALAATALVLGGSAAGAKETTAEKGEAKLAKMLEGRSPGEPVQCITTMRSNGLQVIDHVAVVYDAGSVIYVARPTDRMQLGRNDILVIDRFSGSRLCASDVVRTIDRGSGFPTGVVFLDSFVPYTKDEG